MLIGAKYSITDKIKIEEFLNRNLWCIWGCILSDGIESIEIKPGDGFNITYEEGKEMTIDLDKHSKKKREETRILIFGE